MANENEIHALRTHAEDRIKSHGTNALLKVRATLCRDIVNTLTGAQTKVEKAATPPDADEHAEIATMREERDAASSAQATAERELVLLRGVVEAFETGKKKDVTAANNAYRDEYPAGAGNTAERAPDGSDAENAGEGNDNEGGEGGGE
jgi:hypothetical protein